MLDPRLAGRQCDGPYNLLNDAFALTPSVSIGTPTHDYNYFGEAVVGRNLNEVRLTLGRRTAARFHLSEVRQCPVVIRTPSSSRCSTCRTIAATSRSSSAFLISRRVSARGSVSLAAFTRRPSIDRVRHRRAIRAVRSHPERQLRSRGWRRGVLAAAHRRLRGLPRLCRRHGYACRTCLHDRHELAVSASCPGRRAAATDPANILRTCRFWTRPI